MIEIKECPFCGFTAKLAVKKEYGICVRCTNIECRCQTPWSIDDFGMFGEWPEKTAIENVMERWNRRSVDFDKKDISNMETTTTQTNT